MGNNNTLINDEDRDLTWDELLSRVVSLVVENEKLVNRNNKLVSNIKALEIENESLKDDIENLKFELKSKR